MKSVDPYAAIYPRQYVALRAPPPPPHPSSSSSTLDESPGSLPAATTATTIDGDLDKSFWSDVDWTDDFVDIATDTSPGFRTKVKMRWDDEFLYVGGWVCVCPVVLFSGGVFRCFSRSNLALALHIFLFRSESDPPPHRCILGELAPAGHPCFDFNCRMRRGRSRAILLFSRRFFFSSSPTIGRDGRVGDAHGT